MCKRPPDDRLAVDRRRPVIDGECAAGVPRKQVEEAIDLRLLRMARDLTEGCALQLPSPFDRAQHDLPPLPDPLRRLVADERAPAIVGEVPHRRGVPP